MRPWKRRLSDDECSVLLAELLLRHPELAAEAEEITSTDLARMVYKKVKPLQLSLPSLADECPEWEWYEASWNPYR